MFIPSSNNSIPIWLDIEELLDGDKDTCSQIPNGTSKMILHLKRKIRGETTITLVTKDMKCVPPFGVLVSAAYCEGYETCSLESICFSQRVEKEGQCTYHCKWQKNIMGNAITVSVHFGVEFQVCEISLGH